MIKFYPNCGKIYRQREQKNLRQPAWPPQIPLLSTSHYRTWVSNITIRSQCPGICLNSPNHNDMFLYNQYLCLAEVKLNTQNNPKRPLFFQIRLDSILVFNSGHSKEESPNHLVLVDTVLCMHVCTSVYVCFCVCK